MQFYNLRFWIKFSWLLLLLWTISFQSIAQQKIIDSLSIALKKHNVHETKLTIQDTTFIKLWNGIASAYYVVNADSAIAIGKKSRKRCQKLAYTLGEGEALRVIGLGYNQKGAFEEAIQYYQMSLSLFKNANDERATAKTLNSLGNTYKNRGDYFLALTTHREGLKIREKLKDKLGASATLNNIGNIYYDQEDYKTAITYYDQSIQLKEEVKDIFGVPMILNNVGGSYMKLGDFKKALSYHEKSIDISKKNGDKRVWAMNLHGIGEVYRRQGKYELALQHYLKSTELKLILKDKWGLMYDFFAVAQVYTAQGDMAKSIEAAEKAATLAKEIKSPKEYKDICKLLYENYKKTAQYNLALLYFEAHKVTSDSLYNIDKSKAINNLESKVALEKKEQQFAILQLASQKQKEAGEFQRVIIYLVLLGFASVLLFALFVYRSRQVQKRLNVELAKKQAELQTSNEELQQSQEEIIAQRDHIEEQNKDLAYQNTQTKHSIMTALAIQKALLPFDNRVRGILKDYFVLYQPRDIVSGDFYWIEKLDNQVIVVAADCTGHGVPGAFMSLIAINLLERVVLQNKVTSPPQILRDLHDLVRSALKQDEIENQSGMDLGIVTITNGNTLHFSGAKRPLYFIDSSNPTEVRVCGGSRKSIGGLQNEAKDFEEVMMVLPTESMFYLSSDGLADQNNIKRKRLKEEPVLNVLLATYKQPLENQRLVLSQLLENHMTGTEQRDDILLLGVKI